MALLGTLVDKQGGNTLSGSTTNTYNHSLATNPDMGWLILRSLQNGTAPGIPVWVGANASLSTVALTSACGAGIAQFDLFSVYFFSAVR